MAIYEDWLLKSKRDLDTSKVLLQNTFYDTSIYHTQQCAEKALKGYCVYRRQPLTKTHDLEKILNICIELDSNFSELDILATSLNGLDVRFRYPDVEFEPDAQEVTDAIGWSERILDFVIAKCI